MSDELRQLTDELERISADAAETFGALSPEQINWRPSPEAWSVGQCFDHLIKSNEMYFNDLDRIAAGTRKNSLYERWSPLTGFGGRFLVNSLKSDARKVKTIARATPPSEIGANIVEIFAAHQTELAGKIARIDKTDWRNVVLTSPFTSFITYSLADGLQSIVEHERRHLRQAAKVTETNGFPQ